MFIQLLQSNLGVAAVWVVAILVSLTLHEFSHAFVARLRGDHTAEREGRLDLNPFAHIDPIGFLALLFLGFGWAKPVPYNPYNLRHPKWDSVLVALAGPAMNVVIAVVAALCIHVLAGFHIVSSLNLLIVFLFLLILINLFLAFFNLIPVHPLDGSKLFFALFDAPKYAALRHAVAVYGPQVLMVLVVLSIATPIDIFAFVSTPAYASCDALLQSSCQGLLYVILSAR